MTIETKYNIGDDVFIIYYNQISKHKILEIGGFRYNRVHYILEIKSISPYNRTRIEMVESECFGSIKELCERYEKFYDESNNSEK